MYAPLVLRVVVGLIFAVHGYQKFTTGITGIGGFFGNIGIPFPTVMAAVVIFVELVGGIALILGLGVRYFGLLMAITMAVAILKVHFVNGLTGQGGYEFALTLLAASLSLALSGAGPLSLDDMLCGKKKKR
jgi:putative oxidoreductase